MLPADFADNVRTLASAGHSLAALVYCLIAGSASCAALALALTTVVPRILPARALAGALAASPAAALAFHASVCSALLLPTRKLASTGITNASATADCVATDYGCGVTPHDTLVFTRTVVTAMNINASLTSPASASAAATANAAASSSSSNSSAVPFSPAHALLLLQSHRCNHPGLALAAIATVSPLFTSIYTPLVNTGLSGSGSNGAGTGSGAGSAGSVCFPCPPYTPPRDGARGGAGAASATLHKPLLVSEAAVPASAAAAAAAAAVAAYAAATRCALALGEYEAAWRCVSVVLTLQPPVVAAAKAGDAADSSLLAAAAARNPAAAAAATAAAVAEAAAKTREIRHQARATAAVLAVLLPHESTLLPVNLKAKGGADRHGYNHGQGHGHGRSAALSLATVTAAGATAAALAGRAGNGTPDEAAAAAAAAGAAAAAEAAAALRAAVLAAAAAVSDKVDSAASAAAGVKVPALYGAYYKESKTDSGSDADVVVAAASAAQQGGAPVVVGSPSADGGGNISGRGRSESEDVMLQHQQHQQQLQLQRYQQQQHQQQQQARASHNNTRNGSSADVITVSAKHPSALTLPSAAFSHSVLVTAAHAYLSNKRSYPALLPAPLPSLAVLTGLGFPAATVTLDLLAALLRPHVLLLRTTHHAVPLAAALAGTYVEAAARKAAENDELPSADQWFDLGVSALARLLSLPALGCAGLAVVDYATKRCVFDFPVSSGAAATNTDAAPPLVAVAAAVSAAAALAASQSALAVASGMRARAAAEAAAETAAVVGLVEAKKKGPKAAQPGAPAARDASAAAAGAAADAGLGAGAGAGAGYMGDDDTAEGAVGAGYLSSDDDYDDDDDNDYAGQPAAGAVGAGGAGREPRSVLRKAAIKAGVLGIRQPAGLRASLQGFTGAFADGGFASGAGGGNAVAQLFEAFVTQASRTSGKRGFSDI